MDKDTSAQIGSEARTLRELGGRMYLDCLNGSADYGMVAAMTNRAGKAIAAIRDALERVPQEQR